jgi:acyl-CoA synthetase (AMP-forming)/AMP-acid ligase II
MAFETRLTPAMAARWRGAGLWSDETLATVLARRVGETPDREALTDGTHRLTYRELVHGIDRMAARLRALGIGVGDVVTIQLPNWVEFAFVFFALERLGAVAVTVSVDFRSRELEYIMRFAGSKMLVCCGLFRDFDHVAMAAELKPKLPALECIGVVRGIPRADESGSGRVSSARSCASSDALCARTSKELPRWPLASLASAAGPGMVSLDDVVAGSGPPAGFVPVPMNADTIMRMAFTSGTTGNPKGVMHSHNTTLAAARILNGDVGLSADDVMMIWLPLGLNWGYLTLVQSILAGAKAVLLDRFRPAAALDLIERERVTYIPTAPASLTTILQEPELARRDLSSLRIVVSGGASAPVETIRAWRRAAPGILLELLGMLETGYQAYTRATDDPEQVAGSVGRPASHMGLKLVDADGREVAHGEEGDICCDGPSVHLGYHNNPAANAEAFLPDGWFRSGDLGMIDPDGNLRIVGRLKEMINRGGKKFFPREIEEILYTHRQVLYAAIVGIPDPRLGERNCLCLVPRPGETPTLASLVGFLGDSVATYKLPERLELFTQFPFTPTGKIQRHALVREVVARMSTGAFSGKVEAGFPSENATNAKC